MLRKGIIDLGFLIAERVVKGAMDSAEKGRDSPLLSKGPPTNLVSAGGV
jgi:hypothetical protein